MNTSHSALPLRKVRRWAFLTVLLAILSSQPLLAQDGGDRESRVRAAFVYKFINFVEWPPKAFESTAGDLRICVVGGQSIGDALSRTVSGKAVKQRNLLTAVITKPSELSDCQVLYIGASARQESWLEASRDYPVLTVSSNENFAIDGGMIQLVIDGGKMRFDINRRSADESGLTVSSRLLKVARNVRTS